MNTHNTVRALPAVFLGAGVFAALAVSFAAGAVVGPTLVPQVRAQGAKVESRCVKNEEEANLLGSQGWEVVTAAGASDRQFRYCLVRRLD